MNIYRPSSELFKPQGKHRAAIGVVAVVLSLGIHVVVFMALPEFSFERGTAAKTPEPPRRITLSNVPYEPRSEEPSRPATFTPENPNVAVDMPRHIEKFRRAIDETLTAPRPLPSGSRTGLEAGIAEPTARPFMPARNLQQRVLAIEDRIAPDTVNSAPRPLVDDTSRVANAPDISFPTARPKPGTEAAVARPGPFGADGSIRPVLGGISKPPSAPTASVPINTVSVPDELPAQVTQLKQIENMLQLDVLVYTTPKDEEFGYFRLNIRDGGVDALPRMPKDIIFLQDCSASITEQRLHFCRQGLLRGLPEIGPQDRFNIMYFRDNSVKCFEEWTSPTPAALGTARTFINRMTSKGETDILASVQEMLKLKRESHRPVIVMLVTDGLPTVGLTDSTEIIEKFSKANKGNVSVFPMGTIRVANSYLLDLLGYRNRGDGYVVTSGRWGIPDAMQRRLREVSDPMLTQLHHVFSRTTSCEVYPTRTTNLYRGRPLVLYGRFPLGMGKAAFQIVGNGVDVDCDIIFPIDLRTARSGKKEIRKQWAWQKVYYLIGEYTRTGDPRIFSQIRKLGATYGIKVPYHLGSR